jgi:hypothetical protein
MFRLAGFSATALPLTEQPMQTFMPLLELTLDQGMDQQHSMFQIILIIGLLRHHRRWQLRQTPLAHQQVG